MADPHEAQEAPDWRRPAAYDYTRGFTRRDWAWEFLRRNPDYRRSWRRDAEAVAVVSRPPRLTVLKSRIPAGHLTRWGLLFR